MKRNTQTGNVLELMSCTALIQGGYNIQRHKHLGQRPGGGKHIVDIIAEKVDKMIISLKWQQVQGTAEDKVPFEIISLACALKDNKEYSKAYLVLGGEGWKRKKFFTENGLSDFLNNCEKVNVITMEKFIAMANRTEL